MHDHITLPNGVQILTEPMPGVRSAALGIWVGTGSREERPAQSGAAHFIEHMVFKGTDELSAAQIAQEMDRIGGQMNAFTTKECTCFYIRTLDEHLDRALEILCSMFFDSAFAESDVEAERGVILEEIGMYEDSPEDLCSDRLMSAVFPGCALGRPILGRPGTLNKFTGRRLNQYMKDHYRGGNTVISLAGSFEPRHVERLKERFSALDRGTEPSADAAAYVPAVTVRRKPIEQNHLCLAFPGLAYAHPDRYAAQLLINILGGGMSSRLFQKVREEAGLCYSIYSFGAGYRELGLFGIATALHPRSEAAALELIVQILEDFRRDGVTAEELQRAREQVKANVLMGLESTQSRMNLLGRSQLFLGYVPTADEVVAAYNRVSAEDILRLANEQFRFDDAALSAVGRTRSAREYRTLLGLPEPRN